MRFLFVLNEGKGSFLADKVKEEGNTVLIKDNNEATHPFIDKYADNRTVVIFDEATQHFSTVADRFRAWGILVLGAGKLQHLIRTDPDHGRRLLKAAGVKEVKYDGEEFTIEGWFNGYDWIHKSLSSTLPERYLFVGGLGPKVESMGGTTWFWRHSRPKIFKDTLYKLTSLLRRAEHKGPVTLSITPREMTLHLDFQYTSLHALPYLLNQDVGRFLFEVARGTIKQIKPSYSFASTLFISRPPYPYKEFGTVHSPEVLCETGQKLSAIELRLYSRAAGKATECLQYRTDIISYRARKEIPKLLKEVV